MKINLIYHSGFSRELEKSILLFDWYRGELPEFQRRKDGEEKDYYIFATHSHSDHFSEKIFSLRKNGRRTHYILSSDIREKLPPSLSSDCSFLSPGESLSLSGLFVRAFFSTDLGAAFHVEIEGRSIFHAGDLNLWYWEGEPEEENLWQEKRYREEIRSYRDFLGGRTLDCAFLPLDPRLEKHALDGFLYFLEEISARAFIPMHYWDSASDAKAYLSDPRLSPWLDKIHFLKKTEEFTLQ